jgi:hypothetical protein
MTTGKYKRTNGSIFVIISEKGKYKIGEQKSVLRNILFTEITEAEFDNETKAGAILIEE